MGSRALARVCCLLVAALVTSPAFAFRRLVEVKDVLVRPAFALVAGVGTYNPAGNGGSSQLQLTTALRYLRPDRDDATWHSLGFELGISTWSSSSADILNTYGEVIYFWPRTEAFTFDHHFFAGLGLGSARVDRPAPLASQTETVGRLEAGLQGRVRDWFLELRLKYEFGPDNVPYDVTGFAPSISAAYHFQL
jgi:hypothetical protein